MACNVCNTLIKYHASIHDISPIGYYFYFFICNLFIFKIIARKKCHDCGSSWLRFEFNKLKTPLPNGETSYEGCTVCDDLLNDMTETIGRCLYFNSLRFIDGSFV